MRSFTQIFLVPLVLLLCSFPVLSQVTVEYLHTDHLGTPVAVTNSDRVVIERLEYLPYGESLAPASLGGPGFTGHVEDERTGLSYMQQRYYDPALGLFLSSDPVTVQSSGDTRYFSRYSYAFNNPYRFVDPDGRQSFGHESDMPWWNFTGRVGNWFNETRDYSAQHAFARTSESVEALESQYKAAGQTILTVQTLALPEFAVATKAELGTARFFSASGDRLAARFFDRTRFSERIAGQTDAFHAFPASVEGFAARFGEVSIVKDSRGVSVQMLRMRGEMEGSKGWVQGTFEFIKNKNNEIYHRLFRPD